jgi:hypothetical protein
VKHNPETGKPRWSARVRKEKIRQLYQKDASGIVDEELLDDVGTTLYCRCVSIIEGMLRVRRSFSVGLQVAVKVFRDSRKAVPKSSFSIRHFPVALHSSPSVRLSSERF